MVQVQYTGTSNFREISAADWKSVGVEDQGKVVWDRDNLRTRKDAKQVNEITEEAFAWLQENESSEHTYKVVEDQPVDVPNLPEPGDTTGTLDPDSL